MTGKPAEGRQDVDWDALRKDYRTGQFSDRELGKRYGVSHVAIGKRVKKEGWTKDLMPKVREAVTDRLVTGAAGSRGKDVPVEEIIDKAAERAVEVIEQHRNDIRTLRRLRDRLIAEYEKLTGEKLAPGKKRPAGQPKGLGSLGDISTAASVLERISRVNARIQMMERQAWNISGMMGGDEGEAAIDEYRLELPSNGR